MHTFKVMIDCSPLPTKYDVGLFTSTRADLDGEFACIHQGKCAYNAMTCCAVVAQSHLQRLKHLHGQSLQHMLLVVVLRAQNNVMAETMAGMAMMVTLLVMKPRMALLLLLLLLMVTRDHGVDDTGWQGPRFRRRQRFWQRWW